MDRATIQGGIIVRTVQTKLYNFEELSKEAQQKAIDNLRDINVDYQGWDEHIMDAAFDCNLKITSYDTYHGNIEGE
jgi:uncharacterized protein (DUF2342 family)